MRVLGLFQIFIGVSFALEQAEETSCHSKEAASLRESNELHDFSHPVEITQSNYELHAGPATPIFQATPPDSRTHQSSVRIEIDDLSPSHNHSPENQRSRPSGFVRSSVHRTLQESHGSMTSYRCVSCTRNLEFPSGSDAAPLQRMTLLPVEAHTERNGRLVPEYLCPTCRAEFHRYRMMHVNTLVPLAEDLRLTGPTRFIICFALIWLILKMIADNLP